MNQRINELENRIVDLTRRIETLTALRDLKFLGEIQSCISQVNGLKLELEFEKQNQAAEDAWVQQNIFDED